MCEIDFRFIELCNTVASWSKDRSTKVGSVIVGPDKEIRSIGYNGFPRGIDDTVEERYERPLKYKWTCHAEANAICNAARVGTPLKGCTMYLQWFPCTNCALLIIQAGIKTVVASKPDFSDFKVEKNRQNWGEDFAISKQMFEEAGIEVIFYDN